MTSEFYVYIIECDDGSYYTGYTNSIPRRFYEHQIGRGALYTKINKPVKIIYREVFETRAGAMRREREIKRMTRRQKEELINEG